MRLRLGFSMAPCLVYLGMRHAFFSEVRSISIFFFFLMAALTVAGGMEYTCVVTRAGAVRFLRVGTPDSFLFLKAIVGSPIESSG